MFHSIKKSDKNDDNDVEIGLGLNINAGNTAADATANSEIKVDLSLNPQISDIDMILGDQEQFESDAEDNVEVNLKLHGATDIGSNIKTDIDIEVDIDANADANVELAENSGLDGFDGIADISTGIEADVAAGINVDIDLTVDSDVNKSTNLEIKLPKMNLGLGDVKTSVEVELPTVESRRIYEVNKWADKIPAREPDIQVRIDVDEINKTANFVIEMPDKWNKKVLNKWEEPKFKGDNRKLNGYLDTDENEREKERLEVEINMFIGKENLEDSTVYALISPMNLSEEESFSKKMDFKWQLPKFDFPKFSLKSKSPSTEVEPIEVQGNIDGDIPDTEIGVDGSTKRRDFRFQLPKIDFPTLNLKGKPKTDIDIEIDNSAKVEIPDGDLEVESPTKRRDFRFQLPKVDFSLFGKSPNANVDVDVEVNEDEIRPEANIGLKSEVELESPTKRFDFRFHFPKIEFPSLGGKGNVNAEVDLDADGNVIDGELNVDGTPKRHDFRYQLPKIDLPKIDLPTIEIPVLIYKPKSHNAMADIDINTNKTDIDADLELEIPSADFNTNSRFKKPDFNFQLPTIDFTVFRRRNKSTDVEGNVDVTVDGDVEVESPTKRYDFRFQLPKVEFPSLRSIGKPKVDDDLEIEIDANKSDLEIEVDVNADESQTKRRDFRFNLPKIDFPSLGFKGKSATEASLDADVNVDGNVSNVEIEVEQPTKRHDFSFKLPKVDFSGFGFQKSANANVDVEVTIDEDEIRPEASAVLKSEMEFEGDVESPTKKTDFRFQFPKINFPSFRSKEKPSVEINGEIEGEVNDADVQAEKRHDFRFQLPKVNLPSLNIKQKIDAARNFGLEFDADTRRYDFTFAYPNSKFNTENGKVLFRENSVKDDGDFNEFIVLFDEGESNRPDINVFEVVLKNGVLTCRERHCGEWRFETKNEVVCLSPKKNWLVVFLPQVDNSEAVVVFNEEVIVKYQLQATINTLQSFDVEGFVKIHAAKLFGE